MGMMINEAIEHGKEQLDIFGGEHKEFIETSIATMRKYQKIEQILHNGFGKGVYAVFDEIVKVVEDGKDD